MIQQYQTKPETREIIRDRNSKIHHLKHNKTGEEMFVKNISKWARDNGMKPKTVLSEFCDNRPVRGWIRINVS